MYKAIPMTKNSPSDVLQQIENEELMNIYKPTFDAMKTKSKATSKPLRMTTKTGYFNVSGRYL